MFGHLKVSSKPQPLRPPNLGSTGCCTLMSSGAYQVPGHSKTIKVKMGHALYLTLEMTGNLVSSKEGVGCEGEQVHLRAPF